MEFAQKTAKIVALVASLLVIILLWQQEEVATPVEQSEILTPSIAPTLTPSPSVVAAPSVAGIQGEEAYVTRVVDGDTVVLQDGRRVRYIGIDTPETVAPGKPVQCGGPEASSRNKQLVEGKSVRLVKDVSETDRLGRLLRYVYVGDVFVNETLVVEGLAHSSPYPPDVTQQDVLDAAERTARSAQAGIWGLECQSPLPSPVPSGCDIKGNISGGEKIYHTSRCGSYSQVKIDTTKGERIFCTEAQAQAAGWRPAENCTP